MNNSIVKPKDCFLYRRKEINYVNMPIAYLDAKYGYIPGGALKGYVLIVKKGEPEEYLILNECAIPSTKLDEIKTVLDGLFNPINLGEEVKVVTS